MKQNFKKIKFLLLLVMGFMFFSCTTEEDAIHQHNHDQKISIEKMQFAELMEIATFSRAISRIPKKKNVNATNGKTAMEEQYGFEIVDVPVKVINYEGETYYTLLINSDDKTDNKLENLVLYADPTGDYLGYIVKYGIDKDLATTEESVKQAGIEDTNALTADGIENSDLSKFVVISFFYSLCDGIPFDCGGSICGYGYFHQTMWLPDTGGSGGVGGGTSAGGSSNSSGTAPTPPCQGKNCPDPIITAPVLDVRQDVIAEIIEERINDNQLDDCGKDILNKLKNLTQNDISTIMSKLGETNSIYNLNIMSETPLTENALAATDWSRNLEGEIIPYNYTIKIIPHETMVSTNLAIAGTMLHEIVHAYFLSLIDDCNQTGNCTQLATFPEL